MKIAECYRAAYRAAIRAGWTVTRTGKGHLRWQPPVGIPVITSNTGHTKGAGVRHDITRLRRAGLNIGRGAS